MCNVATKVLTLVLTGILMGLSGCKSGASADDLLQQARRAYDQRQYSLTVALIDSLQRSCPEAVEQRRAATHLSLQAREKITAAALTANDSLIVKLTDSLNSMQPKMLSVKGVVDSTLMAKGMPTALDGSTPLQARIAPELQFNIVATTNKPGVHNALTLRAADKTLNLTLPAEDGELHSRVGATERIYLFGNDADTLGSFIAQNVATPITVSFGSPEVTEPLPAKTAEAIALTWRYRDTARALRSAIIHREQLAAQIIVLRNQVARTRPD